MPYYELMYSTRQRMTPIELNTQKRPTLKLFIVIVF